MGGMFLLPPAPDKCQICATAHGPNEPHNYWSLYYQFRFRGQYGRDATHSDAVAHLPESVQQKYKALLPEYGHTWNEPPEGQAPIAEPLEQEVQPRTEARHEDTGI